MKGKILFNAYLLPIILISGDTHQKMNMIKMKESKVKVW